MQINISLSQDGYGRHFENIKTVFGEGATMPNLETLDTLTIKYKLDMNLNSSLLQKLRAMLEMAEDEAGVCIADFEEDTLHIYSECIRILEDLRNVSQRRKQSELWEEFDGNLHT